MTPLSKLDIQLLSAESQYLCTGDPCRVKAVLKQLNSKDMSSFLELHSTKDMFYFILDVSIVCEQGRPFSLLATASGNNQTIFRLETKRFTSEFDFETKSFPVNRICDSLKLVSNVYTKMGEASNINYYPEFSILYYELTKF
jgi:hypothetical protein